MSKQDRQGVRTATDLERKYGFGKSFAEVMQIATDAQVKAEEAEERIEGLDHDEIFNLLTKDGALQGLYRGEDGDLYINASYIKAGIIKSPDGESLVINLDEGTIDATGSLKTEEVIWLGAYTGKAEMSGNVIKVECKDSTGRVMSGISLSAGIDGAGIDAPAGINCEYYVDSVISDEVLTTWGDNTISSIFDFMSIHATKNICLNMTQSTMNGQSGVWFVTIMKEDIFGGTVKAVQQGKVMYKTMTSGTWNPWEWESPPMLPGVMYRTTKRYNGKPIYRQLNSIGKLPNNTLKTASIDVSSNTYRLIDFKYNLISGDKYVRAFPTSTLDIYFAGDWGVYIMYAQTTSDLSHYTCEVVTEFIEW